MALRLTKRGGTIEKFAPEKIKRALLLAFNAVGDVPNVAPLVTEVMVKLRDKVKDKTVAVEEVQNIVESVLMDAGHHTVARRFIVYRHERSLARARRLSPDSNALPSYIHISKYARYQETLGRREVYKETVERDLNMHLKMLKNRLTDPSILASIMRRVTDAFQFVHEKKELPSMRSFQFAGAAIEADNARMFNCSFCLIDTWRRFQEIFYLLLCGCGVGYSIQWQHIEQLSPVIRVDKKKVVHHTIADTIIGWADAVGALVEAYTVTGVWVEFNYSLIRDEGVPLKTSGGRAPGHLPLRKCLEAVRIILSNAAGRQLRPIEASDFICHMAEAVLAGGIRRSSLIGIFSSHDTEMLYAKARGNFEPERLNSFRQMVNLSAALLRGSTHRSIFDRIIRVAQENFGDPGFIFLNDLNHGTNPCYIGKTLLHTDRGLKRIEDLVGQGPQNVIQMDGSILPATQVECTGKDVDIYRVELASGHSVTATAYHEFPTFNGHKQIKDLIEGEDILFLQHKEGQWGQYGSYEEGLILGLWYGDGTTKKNKDLSIIYLFGEEMRWSNYIEDCLNIVTGEDLHFRKEGKGICILSKAIFQIVGRGKDQIPEQVMLGSRDIVRGFLEGFIFADGCISRMGINSYTLRLGQSNKKALEQTQILLSNFGIQSRVRLTKEAGSHTFPDGKVSQCKSQYQLFLNKNNLIKYMHKVGLFGPKYERYVSWGINSCKSRIEDKYWSKIISIKPAGREDVYCLNQPKTHNVVVNGIFSGQCGEIGLNPVLESLCGMCKGTGNRMSKTIETKSSPIEISIRCLPCKGKGTIRQTGFSFCNLCELNMATVTSRKDFLERIEAAAIIGTLQACYTSFPYLGEVSEGIAKREALLGIGMAGIQDNRKFSMDGELLKEGALLAIEVNKEWAEILDIKQAARVTTVKPGGTSPLELGVIGSGIHPMWSRRYFQRVTANRNEPAAQEFKRVNPHMVDMKPNGDWSLVFPIEVPEGVVTVKEMPAMRFVEDVLHVYRNWVLPGTARPKSSPGLTHNVSCSVTMKPEELVPICDKIWSERDNITAMSFIPYTLDSRFAYAPRQAVETSEDEARWERLIANYRPVDWSMFKEEEDNTVKSIECTGQVCEI